MTTAPAISSATHNATSIEISARCTRIARAEPVVRLLLAARTVAACPRIARMPGTTDAATAASTAINALNACTRQSIDTSPSVCAMVGLIASNAGTAPRASSKPGIRPARHTISNSARPIRSTSPLDAPRARRNDNSPDRATTCAEVRFAMLTQAISSTRPVAAISISSGARIEPYCHSRTSTAPIVQCEWVRGNSCAS